MFFCKIYHKKFTTEIGFKNIYNSESNYSIYYEYIELESYGLILQDSYLEIPDFMVFLYIDSFYPQKDFLHYRMNRCCTLWLFEYLYWYLEIPMPTRLYSKLRCNLILLYKNITPTQLF